MKREERLADAYMETEARRREEAGAEKFYDIVVLYRKGKRGKVENFRLEHAKVSDVGERFDDLKFDPIRASNAFARAHRDPTTGNVVTNGNDEPLKAKARKVLEEWESSK